MRFPLPFTLAAACIAMVPAGCASLEQPSQVANKTTFDERAGISAEVLYTTASKLGTVLAKAGLVDSAKFKALDDKAYSALVVTREAYRTGNAESFEAATLRLKAAIAEINALVETNEPR